jgi:hypothetical protein
MVKRWSKGTVQLAVVMVAAGFVLMALGWNGAAGFDTPQQQFPYLLSGTVPGLGLVLAGLTLALIQELRRATGMIIGKLEELSDSTADGATGSTPTAVPTDGSTVVAGKTTYHLPSCALVAGRNDLQAMAPEEATDRGLAACRICEPAAKAS